MKHHCKIITLSNLMILAILLISTGCETVSIKYSEGLTGGSLPPCQGSYSKSSWTKCYGLVELSDGREYIGELRNGVEHGQGTLTLADGGAYVGEFRNGKPWNGKGTSMMDTGDKYVGEIKNGKIHGQGTYYYLADNEFKGNKYVGEFRNGEMHGQGTGSFANGDKYVGEFRNNKFNGQGTGTFRNGRKYVGEFKDGKYHGQGIGTFPDGRKYVGEFRNDKFNGQGIFTFTDGRVKEGIWKDDKFLYAQKTNPSNQPPLPEVARVIPEKAIPKPPPQSGSSGSGFFVSKMGHVITNAHVVKGCQRVTVGDDANTQSPAEVISSDTRNDLALLKLSSLDMASSETKALVRKLEIKIVPLASDGLLRSDDVELGEKVLVAGYPYGDIFSNTIKVTGGMVSATRGMGDDTGQFQLDAAVQPGNSGGPIYDGYGNVVGVVVSQLNKLKVAKAIGSMPENVNFGIKASTVRQFLTASGLPSKWSQRSKELSNRQLAKIAQNQALMVVCFQ